MDSFFDTPQTKKQTEQTEPMSEFVNLADICNEKDVKDEIVASKELVKVADILYIPIVITGYKEDTMKDFRKDEQKECFRMDFYFADDEKKTPHFIRTEASHLWLYLRTVEKVKPGLLASGTVVTSICKDEKKKGSTNNTPYYFAGTQ